MKEWAEEIVAAIDRNSSSNDRLANAITALIKRIDFAAGSSGEFAAGNQKKAILRKSALEFIASLNDPGLPMGFHLRTTNGIKNINSYVQAAATDPVWMQGRAERLKRCGLPKGIVTVADLANAIRKEMYIEQVGKKCLDAIRRALQAEGVL